MGFVNIENVRVVTGLIGVEARYSGLRYEWKVRKYSKNILGNCVSLNGRRGMEQ